ncbi:MAG: hypothetical protein ACR2OY_13000 [Boseongicola sp.]
MISFATKPAIAGKTAANVIGPFSEWPRRGTNRATRAAVYAGSVSLIGVFLHCAAPLIV